MNNTIDALRALYVALGGAEADVADITIIPDMINKIAELVTPEEYKLTKSGANITVKRGDDTLANNAKIYKGDVLTITFTGDCYVNGTAWTSGNGFIVSGNVTVSATA